jgi:hypothetical protein
MANLLLAAPNWADVSVLHTPALSGGSWSAALPLANLQDRRVARVARASDALAASTQFNLDMGTARATRVVALVGHNFTSAATVEVDGGTSAGASDVYNGSAVAAYPAGETTETLEGLTPAYLLVLPSVLTFRHLTVKIADTSNPAGYVQVGRLFVANAYQPTINAQYGLQQGFDDDSTSVNADGGATIHSERRKRRWATFTLPEIPAAEALASLFPLLHRQGTTRQWYFVFDPTDTTHLFRRSFLCRFRELGALEMATLERYGKPVALVEEL